MIIHKLTLNNFGLFRGRQVLQLIPNGRGPVILIGGMNGAGKTTLLEAVKLCLYGRRALGNRVSRKEYHEYLSEMIHREQGAKVPLNQASVSLEFEFSHTGEATRYQVERAWRQKGPTYNSIIEDLTIQKNEWLDTDFEAAHWQDHINELIPIGVSQFFFFDGEDIRKLADDSSHDLFLAESIKRLLGLNLVERLQSDLRIYANRLAKHSTPEPLLKDIEEAESEIATLTASLKNADEQLESTQTKIEKLAVQISRQETRIAAEGGAYAEKRESLKLQQEQLYIEIEELENEIRDLCAELFPFALVPDLLKQLKERLLKEIELSEWEEKNRVLKTQYTELIETLEAESFWGDTALSKQQIIDIQTKITPLLKTQLELPEGLHGFEKKRERSSSEYNQLFKWIDTCLNDIPQGFREVNEALKNAQLELQKGRTRAAKSP